MQTAHPGNEPDSINSGALSLVLGLVAVSTFAIALVVTALVRDETHAVNKERDLTQDAPFRQLKSSQLGALEAPAQYKDRTKGVVSLPIGRAMALTLEGVRRNPTSLSPWTPQPEAVPAEALPTPTDSATEAPEGTEGASTAPVAPTSPTGTAPSPAAPSPAAPSSVAPSPAASTGIQAKSASEGAPAAPASEKKAAPAPPTSPTAAVPHPAAPAPASNE